MGAAEVRAILREADTLRKRAANAAAVARVVDYQYMRSSTSTAWHLGRDAYLDTLGRPHTAADVEVPGWLLETIRDMCKRLDQECIAQAEALEARVQVVES